MKSIPLFTFQAIGLLFFIVGFMLFNSLFFSGPFQLTENEILEELGEEQYSKLAPVIPELAEKEFATSISFNNALQSSLEKASQHWGETYSLPEEEREVLIMAVVRNELKYQPEVVKDAMSPSAAVKIQAVLDYNNWLEGRQFKDENEVREVFGGNLATIDEKMGEIIGFDDQAIQETQKNLSLAAYKGGPTENAFLWFFLAIILPIIGAMMYILPKRAANPGIKNNHIYHRAMTNRGWLGIITGVWLISFYVVLYWFPHYMAPAIRLVDPVSFLLNGGGASQWFLYGFIYTLAIAIMGVRMLIKYRHSRYHIIRTISLIFFQTCFAFILPEILIALNKPWHDFKNIWPLDYSFFFSYRLDEMMESGTIGFFMLFWGIILIVLAVPLLTYFWGKRWYCSWVCGCGGLAETLGDPYRQLSDKSLKAWKIERWMVHGVLVFAVLMTGLTLTNNFTGMLGGFSGTLQQWYGFMIGSAFAGVIGTGFYPFMGNRVWCRFGCPLAAYLGIVQRFKSRFRITTNGGQCISCGNCSTYCEMGIDVRWYAQRGQNIVRASCVGCGVCSSVCPRGVLKLENLAEKGRFNENPDLLGNESFKGDPTK